MMVRGELARRRGDGGGAHGDRGRDGLDRGAGREERLQQRDHRAGVGGLAHPLPAARLRLVLEPLRERPARAEDQRLDGGLAEVHLLRDLAVREPLPLAQQDRAALALGHPGERLLEPDQIVLAALGRRGHVLDRLQVTRRLDAAAPERGAVAGEADVLGDLEQPRRLGLRHDAAAQPAERVQERVLDRVLRLLARAELVQAVAVDLAGVALVEIPREVGLGRRRGRFDG